MLFVVRCVLLIVCYVLFVGVVVCRLLFVSFLLFVGSCFWFVVCCLFGSCFLFVVGCCVLCLSFVVRCSLCVVVCWRFLFEVRCL